MGIYAKIIRTSHKLIMLGLLDLRESGNLVMRGKVVKLRVKAEMRQIPRVGHELIIRRAAKAFDV